MSVLSKTEYFALYGRVVSKPKVSQRMEQLYDLLNETQKAQARTVLKQDIVDALTLSETQTLAKIQSFQDTADQNVSTVTADVLVPIQNDLTDVNDTNLD